MLQKEELDAVVVSSPDPWHVEHALAGIEAGIPVLVEKPLSRSLRDASKLCEVAETRKVLLMAVANKRYSPPYRRAWQLIEQGEVKNPTMLVGKFNLGYNYVDLFESGTVHLFDLARFLLGDVEQVQALAVHKYGSQERQYPFDQAIVTLQYNSGSIGALYTSSAALSLKPWERIEVYGDHSWLSVEDQWELRLYNSEAGPTHSWQPVVPNTLLFDEDFGGFTGLLENFLQAARRAELPFVTGWDGYKACELSVAAHLSLARKQPVLLPLDSAAADVECQEWLKCSNLPKRDAHYSGQ
jgi:myo-inositol 2-dehydrogenase/D-chiro-inositol 1-dehydrogenase